jgi:hypothetical protein
VNGESVAFPWQILISTLGAGAASLIGVAVGAALSSRNQQRHWTRDKQVDACKEILVESTRAQLGLRHSLMGGERVDWSGWNEALAFTWLVCSPNIAQAARSIDEMFWRYGAELGGGRFSDESWAEARDAIEEARLTFINTARVEIAGWESPLTEAPNARPPLSEPPRNNEIT